MSASHYRGTVLLDLDRCGIGEIMPGSSELGKLGNGQLRFGIRPPSPETMAALFSLIYRNQLDVHFLTYRPPGQVFLFGHLFGAYHLTEGGASAVILGEEIPRINPLYNEKHRILWQKAVIIIEEIIADMPSVYHQIGNRQLTGCYLCPGHSLDNLSQTIINCLGYLNDDIQVKAAYGVVDVTLRVHDKVLGVQWAEQLHPEFYDYGLFEYPLIYLEDSGNATVVDYIVQQGGMVGCPSNATSEFQQAVQKNRGMIASQPYEQGCLELLEQWIKNM